ncbi:hypothetical protein COK_1261 [Mannheimia haemolytica serotype A2 str. BOVINE]|nr:hypothetical protein COK_1261 [Mannheimia haemolytica serotype A2 str. BOVINE]
MQNITQNYAPQRGFTAFQKLNYKILVVYHHFYHFYHFLFILIFNLIDL